ncbi:LytS/YhcK type 5TM receptor domain-containing protein [Virgibacillus necropolis]|uniref:histidine kinase n=1 Tax=Virgibacillus necropolis TaxID=163877 RepID=A0A221MA76_9BACI|nr:LytS/YhcK type 5TM receptor domain-containing protein [Virgibacillus necropolis]ASN04522.1 sensor histidine kinase [Virgibacillus necropolis]
MKYLTIILFERLGLLLVLAFVLTRIPGFRSLLYREFSKRMSFVHACMFGLFGIAGTITGIVIEGDSVVVRDFIWSIGDGQMVVSSSLVAIVIAGLLGGPVVGLGAGIIAGSHLFFVGGIGVIANSLVNPLTGLLAGLTARFFSNERVISPMKALFIGIFPPVLQMHLLLIFASYPDGMIAIVNTIGLPLVLSNSIAIAIFTAMIGIVLKEQENVAALATKQALTIAEEALPFLKKDSPHEMAAGIANLLYNRLKLAAVSVTNEREVLAHKGLGDDHHREGDQIITSLSHLAIASKQMQVAYSRSEIQCKNDNCPLEAAIMIPIMDANDATGVIKFYFRKAQHIRPVELMLAQGLGQLISNQLNTIASEKLKTHIRDAELRNLQAQINPHFLFNTLNLIAALFRKDPEKARHITIQLAHYMRFNIGLVSSSLVHLEKECQHVKAYIDIIQTRFSSRLQINFSEPDDISQVLIPPSTIQPLVENSVQHGLESVTNGGVITVTIEKSNQSIKLTVCDNGCGFPEDILNRVGHEALTENQNGGAGLYNVNQRLISLLGESARLHIRNLPSSGSEVYFTIPYKD